MEWLSRVFEAVFDAVLEKLTNLPEIAGELGAGAFVALVGMYLLYKSFNKNLPLILSAWERNQKNKRTHEHRMAKLRGARQDAERERGS